MRKSQRELVYIYLFFDLVILNISIFLASWLLKGVFSMTVEHKGVYFLLGNISWIITYVFLIKRNLYLRDGFYNRFLRISKRTLIFILISFVSAFVLGRKTFSIHFFVAYCLILYLGELAFYWGLYRGLLYRRRRGTNVSRCVIIGTKFTAIRLQKLIDYNPILGYKFIGYITKEESNRGDVLGIMDDLDRLIQEHHIEMIFVTPFSDAELDHKYKALLNICSKNGVRLRFVPNGKKWNKSGSNVETLAGVPLLDPLSLPLDSLTARFLKRMFDIVFSLLVILLLFTWLFPILAHLINLSSQGPVFFNQERTGFNNRTFKILKFRSMKPNGVAHTKQATLHDDRITRIGRFMRLTNIDELPQFFNVLIGQMSIVGPRPHMLAHTDLYSALIDHYLKRHFVKPGITGWAQVNGLRGETDVLWKMERRVEFDMEYIETWSFWLDIRIIFRTVFGGKKQGFTIGDHLAKP